MKVSVILWVSSLLVFFTGIILFFAGRVETFIVLMVVTFIFGFAQFLLHEMNL